MEDVDNVMEREIRAKRTRRRWMSEDRSTPRRLTIEREKGAEDAPFSAAYSARLNESFRKKGTCEVTINDEKMRFDCMGSFLDYLYPWGGECEGKHQVPFNDGVDRCQEGPERDRVGYRRSRCAGKTQRRRAKKLRTCREARRCAVVQANAAKA